jgi:hypothetical protein
MQSVRDRLRSSNQGLAGMHLAHRNAREVSYIRYSSFLPQTWGRLRRTFQTTPALKRRLILLSKCNQDTILCDARGLWRVRTGSGTGPPRGKRAPRVGTISAVSARTRSSHGAETWANRSPVIGVGRLRVGWPLLRSHAERRCSILGPNQSRISRSILSYAQKDFLAKPASFQRE